MNWAEFPIKKGLPCGSLNNLNSYKIGADVKIKELQVSKPSN